jgi:C4-dicarboxylate-specific signal transduction histidine kinase
MRKEPFDMQPLDVNIIVRDVVQVLDSTAASDGVLLVAHLNPELASVNGDRVQLRQVVMNLVLNGIQATRTFHSAHPVVRVSTAKRDDSVVFVVEDAGPGVPDDALPRLFEPYYTTKEDGLGLGLSISRSIVQSHGGAIAVSNLAQGGARFEVTLPFD